jgi:chemotaxis protein MotB
MARKKPHEDHVNHEAWAIPYGDMLVLLLALFVVMYAVSSVNEGKYRVLADSLQAEFSGAPKSINPIQFGEKQRGSEPDSQSSMMRQKASMTAGGPVAKKPDVAQMIQARLPMPLRASPDTMTGRGSGRAVSERQALEKMGQDIENALGDLVEKKLVRIRSSEQTLEVEIRADILFPSGSAALSNEARPVLGTVASILARFPNPMRVEGHTDSMPISTPIYPSNWELSAARAASVLHLFVSKGIKPSRLSVAGFGEFRPVADNAVQDGRNRNRRVLIVVLARGGESVPMMPTAGTPEPEAQDKVAALTQGLVQAELQR